MKLVRFGPRDAEKPGIVTAAGTIKDVSARVTDYDHGFSHAAAARRPTWRSSSAVTPAGRMQPLHIDRHA